MKLKVRVFSLLFLLLVLQGCGPKTFEVKNPQVSNDTYTLESSANKSNDYSLRFIDNRSDENSKFSYGRLPINLAIEGTAIEPVVYISKNVLAELNARGIDVSLSESSPNDLKINQFIIRNHRTNGFSPFITFSTFQAELEHNNQKHQIATFVKRGKVPVWSFNEVIEPTLNEPLAIVVKEVAAKLNTVIYKKQISDQQVNALVNHIKQNNEDKSTYLKVYELGFGNNPAAIENLVEFTKFDEEYIRLAAISSLGTLQAESQIDYLWSIYNHAKLWQDQAMALKALGDINTEASMAKLKEVKANLAKQKDKTAVWFNEVLKLYLP